MPKICFQYVIRYLSINPTFFENKSVSRRKESKKSITFVTDSLIQIN